MMLFSRPARAKPGSGGISCDGSENRLQRFWRKTLPPALAAEAIAADTHVREGRFQRCMALIAGASSILAGLEVSYEHYRGSFGQKVMWTPVVLSGAMAVSGIWGFVNKWAARTILRWTSAATLLDSVVGFYFHLRGIARKPGGWRLPVANIIMGPPIFAPLLFGVSAYLGLIASFLRAEETPETGPPPGRLQGIGALFCGLKPPLWTQELREGRFQKHLASL
jgi:hypothetical protein